MRGVCRICTKLGHAWIAMPRPQGFLPVRRCTRCGQYEYFAYRELAYAGHPARERWFPCRKPDADFGACYRPTTQLQIEDGT